jgi:wyosine [tRNA(Phe)-imidazoG37] synthetase (radical SAM superfamily)
MENFAQASTVYGPVLSWRLGISLGIDPILPPKACTFDCLYCQLGRTYRKVSDPIGGLPSKERILRDLRKSLALLDINSVDYITFSGSGEPTLNPELGDMIEAVKSIVARPIAILTNSSLLHKEVVRRSLAKVDLVVAKLDAPRQGLLEAINRPAPGILHENIFKGLERLRGEMKGTLAIQIMFFEDKRGKISNTSPQDLEDLICLIERISPEEVQLNTPTRPPSEDYVLAFEPSRMKAVAELFRKSLKNIMVVSRYEERAMLAPKRISYRNIEDEILDLIKRRPCSSQEIAASLNLSEPIVMENLHRLMSQKKVATMKYREHDYYLAA